MSSRVSVWIILVLLSCILLLIIINVQKAETFEDLTQPAISPPLSSNSEKDLLADVVNDPANATLVSNSLNSMNNVTTTVSTSTNFVDSTKKSLINNAEKGLICKEIINSIPTKLLTYNILNEPDVKALFSPDTLNCAFTPGWYSLSTPKNSNGNILSFIHVSIDGVKAVGCTVGSNLIYYCNDITQDTAVWTQVPGQLRKTSIFNGKIVGISANNDLYYAADYTNPGWINISKWVGSGNFSSNRFIACALYGTFLVVVNDKGLMVYANGGLDNPPFRLVQAPYPSGATFTDVSVCQGVVACIDNQNRMWTCRDITDSILGNFILMQPNGYRYKYCSIYMNKFTQAQSSKQNFAVVGVRDTLTQVDYYDSIDSGSSELPYTYKALPEGRSMFYSVAFFGDMVVGYDTSNWKLLATYPSPINLAGFSNTDNSSNQCVIGNTCSDLSTPNGITAVLGRDGNLVVRDSNQKMIWQSNSANKGVYPYKLDFNSNGSVNIVDSSVPSKVVWSTNTLTSPSINPYRFILQSDGNLVLYDMITNNPLWAASWTQEWVGGPATTRPNGFVCNLITNHVDRLNPFLNAANMLLRCSIPDIVIASVDPDGVGTGLCVDARGGINANLTLKQCGGLSDKESCLSNKAVTAGKITTLQSQINTANSTITNLQNQINSIMNRDCNYDGLYNGVRDNDGNCNCPSGKRKVECIIYGFGYYNTTYQCYDSNGDPSTLNYDLGGESMSCSFV